MITSRVKKTIVVLCALCVVLSPANVVAIERNTTTETPKTETVKQSVTKQAQTNTQSNQTKCQALDEISTKLQNQLSQRKATVESKRSEIATKVEARQKTRDSELASKRAEWDTQRQKNFDTLRDKAKTDEQKQAVEDYITAMTEAIKSRRDANDTVFATFRSELEAIKKTSSQSVQTNISNNSGTITQAITSARAACESGQSIETIKQNLQATLLVVRMQAKDNRTAALNTDQLKTIKQKRDAALKANIAAFEKATKEAREKLKAAFKD